MSRMISRYNGRCAACKCQVKAGDVIDYDRATRQVTCEDCAPPDVPTVTTVAVALDGADVSIKLSGRLPSDRFSEFRTILSEARFRDGVNYVSLARASAIVCALQGAGFALDIIPDAKNAIERAESQKVSDHEGAMARLSSVDAILAKSNGSLYRFQREGVEWLAPRTGALVADDMGLGKTIQALTALPADAPIIVVCPAVAKSVWQQETSKWRPDVRVTILSGRGSFRAPVAGEMVVLNYDILPEEVGTLLPLTSVVFDEAHVCATSKTQRTQRARALSAACREVGGKAWELTATPLKNNPQELWNVLRLVGIEHEAFGSWSGYLRAFGAHKGRYGIVWGHPSEVVAERLRRVSLRRKKADVLADLPPKTHRSDFVAIDSATTKLCDAALAELTDSGEGKPVVGLKEAVQRLATTGLGFRQLSAARAALATAKIPAMLSFVESYEEQNEPLVVFSAFRAPIDLLAKRDGWQSITGDTSDERRAEIVEQFQAGKLRGVACTIRAGGVAITLTRASNVLRVDREWNPALNVQAEDRCYRIGQRTSVLVTDLVADHPLDRMIADCISAKEQLISGSVDASAVNEGEVTEPETIAIDWSLIEADAAKAAVEAKAIAESIASAKSETARRRAEKKVAVARAEAQRRVRLAAARRLDESESEEDAPRRVAKTSVELWAIEGLRQLAENDHDRAKEKNGVGFNATHTGIGHALAWLPDLTDQEWRLAVSIARHYPRQIGVAPA